MSTKQEDRFAYRVRNVLNYGTENLDRKAAAKLFEARQKALQHQRTGAGLRFAGVGHGSVEMFPPYMRSLIAGLAIITGVVGTYAWNQYEQAAENEEIDSALLADDLPPTAYLDRGFQVWLAHARQSQE